jgi:SAM-dependent methyltransferase
MDNKLFDSPHSIKRIAEIGPGDSLGIGIAALYTGAENYYAFDVIEHASHQKNVEVTREIGGLYLANAPIPNTNKHRNVGPRLPNYDFPSEYLDNDDDWYVSRRSEIIRALDSGDSSLEIKYVVPWIKQTAVNTIGLDLIYSQAVMEHVLDIESAYGEMYRWLRPGGVISHQIDFKTHEMTKAWNGHWFIGDLTWKLLAHGRKYPINRLPLSAHIDAMEKVGFEIKFILPVEQPNSFGRHAPKVPNVVFSERDLVTSGAFVQAIKPNK